MQASGGWVTPNLGYREFDCGFVDSFKLCMAREVLTGKSACFWRGRQAGRRLGDSKRRGPCRTPQFTRKALSPNKASKDQRGAEVLRHSLLFESRAEIISRGLDLVIQISQPRRLPWRKRLLFSRRSAAGFFVCGRAESRNLMALSAA